MPSTADIEIRPAVPADAACIASCLAEAFEPFRSAYTPSAFADTVPNESQIHIRLRQMHVLVAIMAGKIVGTISATSNVGQGHLRGMAVLPESRSAGVAANLLLSIENWLRSQGCNEVTLDTTMPLKAAIKFYEKNGYQRSGTVSDFFGMPLIEYVKRLS